MAARGCTVVLEQAEPGRRNHETKTVSESNPNPERHSVEHGEILQTSPSQIHTAVLCLLKWWFDKVQHLPRKPQSKSQAKGLDLHAQQEHYLTTGEDVLSPLAREGKPYLPAPGPDLLIEWPIHYRPEDSLKKHRDPATDPRRLGPRLTICGIPMIGFVDVVNPRPLPGLVEVLDHKTTSSIELWAKTPEELRTDAQCAAYCEWARLQYPTAAEFLFGHVYYQTKGRARAARSDVKHNRETLLQAWHVNENVIERMRAAARESDPMRVDHDPDACSAFGGCDYAGTCPFSPQRQFAQSITQQLAQKGSPNTMSLADRLKAKNAAATPPATTPPATTPPPPAAPPPAAAAPPPPPPAANPAAAPPPPAGGVVVANCTVGATYLIPACPGLEGRAADVVSKYAGKAGLWGLFRDDAKNLTRAKLDEVVEPIDVSGAPPEAAPAAPPAQAATPTSTASVLPPDAPKSDPAKAAVPPPAAPPPAVTASQAPATASQAPATAAPVAPKRPGRKPKAAPAPAAAAPQGQAAAPAEDAGDLILFVNCVPSSPYTDLTAYVAQIAADVAKVASVEDVRVAPEGNALAFGKWPGYLAAHAKGNPPTGQCVIFSSQLADPVIEALASIALEVIRGVR